MTDEIRTILDGATMPVDYFLYRLQELLGFEHPACPAIEELRPVVRTSPTVMRAPDLRRNVRADIRRIKGAVDWEQLSEDDKRARRRMLDLCDDVADLVDGDALTIDDWFEAAPALLSANAALKLSFLRESVQALLTRGGKFRCLPVPRKANMRRALSAIYASAKTSFALPGCENLVKRTHSQLRDLRETLQAEGPL